MLKEISLPPGNYAVVHEKRMMISLHFTRK